jgi:hypothetical protein
MAIEYSKLSGKPLRFELELGMASKVIGNLFICNCLDSMTRSHFLRPARSARALHYSKTRTVVLFAISLPERWEGCV